jgi:DUF4097 and DUF4098 domain-containing protein YvlB
MNRKQCTTGVVFLMLAGTIIVVAQTRKEFRYTVGPQATVSVTNQYGPISVAAAAGNQVMVTAVLHSDKVEVDQNQSGNRVDLVSHLLPGADSDSGRVDYQVAVPIDAAVTLHSSTGPLHAEKLHGDVTLEGAGATVDCRDISNAHVHVKTLNGPITLTNINNGHVEITSVTGNVTLEEVSGPFVQVNSSSGNIVYDGDFGYGGEYSLMSHSGNIDATVPTYASIDVTARSIKGQVQNDFPLRPKHTPFVIKAGSAFAGTIGKAGSSVKLLSFSGRIHLKKR